ncbi:hypothetical protein EDB89DRAFT_748070 [Lactarius sanguifluus]|nr:hypothetical protein EDB89DRAFT_748070 [Lactarius sanguifluus]
MRQVPRVHAYYPRAPQARLRGRPSFLGSIMARSLDSQVKGKLSFVEIVLTPPSDRGRYTSAWKWKREPGIAREDIQKWQILQPLRRSSCQLGVHKNIVPPLIFLIFCHRDPPMSSVAHDGRTRRRTYIQAAPNRRRPRISHSFYGIIFAGGFIQQTVSSRHTRPWVPSLRRSRARLAARTRMDQSSTKSLTWSSPELTYNPFLCQHVSVQDLCQSTVLLSQERASCDATGSSERRRSNMNS